MSLMGQNQAWTTNGRRTNLPFRLSESRTLNRFHRLMFWYLKYIYTVLSYTVFCPSAMQLFVPRNFFLGYLKFLTFWAQLDLRLRTNMCTICTCRRLNVNSTADDWRGTVLAQLVWKTADPPRPVFHTVPMVIDFPRNNMKCSGENEILRGIFHVVSRFPLHLHLHVTVQYIAEILITFWKVQSRPSLLQRTGARCIGLLYLRCTVVCSSNLRSTYTPYSIRGKVVRQCEPIFYYSFYLVKLYSLPMLQDYNQYSLDEYSTINQPTFLQSPNASKRRRRSIAGLPPKCKIFCPQESWIGFSKRWVW